MHAILVSVGSMGDTLPFIIIGRALRERGHRVTRVLEYNKKGKQIIRQLRHNVELFRDFPAGGNRRRPMGPRFPVRQSESSSPENAG